MTMKEVVVFVPGYTGSSLDKTVLGRNIKIWPDTGTVDLGDASLWPSGILLSSLEQEPIYQTLIDFFTNNSFGNATIDYAGGFEPSSPATRKSFRKATRC